MLHDNIPHGCTPVERKHDSKERNREVSRSLVSAADSAHIDLLEKEKLACEDQG